MGNLMEKPAENGALRHLKHRNLRFSWILNQKPSENEDFEELKQQKSRIQGRL
jgi:uncharacterized membrane protein (DUF485 family)